MTDSPQGLVERREWLIDRLRDCYDGIPVGVHVTTAPVPLLVLAVDYLEALEREIEERGHAFQQAQNKTLVALREAQKDAIPREPTEAMLIAGYDALSNVQNEDETAEEMMRRAYFAMIDAARKVGPPAP